MESLKSRKFIIAVLVLLGSFVLVINNNIDGNQWFAWAVALVAAYGVPNAISKFAK